MRFLVIVQDLRVSGTSEGVVSRSFLAKLRMTYPNSIIDVLYLKTHVGNEEELDLLPVDSIETFTISLKSPFFIKWVNRITSRLLHFSIYDNYIHKLFAKHISIINPENYDVAFVRSSGINHETILATIGLPILKKSILNFHDPYPLFWYPGSRNKLSGTELSRLKKMIKVVHLSKACTSPSKLLSRDLDYLYCSNNKFNVLPHQFDESVFRLNRNKSNEFQSEKLVISYHGSIQFGRNLHIILEAYKELLNEIQELKHKTEIRLRIKTNEYKNYVETYSEDKNIIIQEKADFYTSSMEQMHEADIILILENGPLKSNILVGKAPFIASLKKPILVFAPRESELRNIINNEEYVALCTDKEEIKEKLKNIIFNSFKSKEYTTVFGDYFGDENFKRMLKEILN